MAKAAVGKIRYVPRHLVPRDKAGRVLDGAVIGFNERGLSIKMIYPTFSDSEGVCSVSTPTRIFYDGNVTYEDGVVYVARKSDSECFTDWRSRLWQGIYVADWLGREHPIDTLDNLLYASGGRIECGEKALQLLRVSRGYQAFCGVDHSIEWFMGTWLLERASEEHSAAQPMSLWMSASQLPVVFLHDAPAEESHGVDYYKPDDDGVFHWDPVPPKRVSPMEHRFTMIDMLHAMAGLDEYGKHPRPVRIRAGKSAMRSIMLLPGFVRSYEQFPDGYLNSRWPIVYDAQLPDTRIEMDTIGTVGEIPEMDGPW